MADHLTQLGNYRLTCLLGEGGFANVYLGEHIYLNTQAAIKVLQMHLGNEESEDFLNEARIIARLVHPHIVRVLEFGIEDNIPFLVMDYAPNGTLRQCHPRGTRLPLTTITHYVKQVAAALQYAHDKKLVHRDVKPENMLLDADDNILLSDFGIAVAQTSRSQQPNIEEAAGTLAYMAPEQLEGKPRPASDQYALGIIVYEWLTGERPFHGTFTELASQHMFIPPAPLREKIPDIPPGIEQAVMKALEKDPHRRFGSVQLFATALEQACVHASSLSTMPSNPMFQPDNGSQLLRQFRPVPTTQKIPAQTGVSAVDQVSRPTPVLPAIDLPTIAQVDQASVPEAATLQLAHMPLQDDTTFTISDPSTRVEGRATIPLPALPRPEHRPGEIVISRRAMIMGLAGLASLTVVGSSIAFLIQHSHTPSHSQTSHPTSAQTPITNTTVTSTVQTPTANPTQQPTATPVATSNPTPTPTDTPVPTATPSPTPIPFISSGTGTLHGGLSFDFDHGNEVNGGGDVYWNTLLLDLSRTLEPVGNAQLANLGVVDYNSLDAASLRSQNYSATSLDGDDDATNQLVNNDVFAVLTNGGNHAKVLIVTYGSDLQIQWITYRG